MKQILLDVPVIELHTLSLTIENINLCFILILASQWFTSVSFKPFICVNIFYFILCALECFLCEHVIGRQYKVEDDLGFFQTFSC